MTFTSLTNSTESGVPTIPKAGLFTERPSTTYWFSGEVVPLIETPYVSAAAPGATSASDSKERVAAPLPLGELSGMWLTKSAPTLTPTVLDPTSTVGALPTTTTSSALSASGSSSLLTRMVLPTRSSMLPRLNTL